MPPPWIIDAAGAELWAFYFVHSISLAMPSVVTDCLGILQTLQTTPQHATSHSMVLARTWGMLAHTLDGCFNEAKAKTLWMPSHQAAGGIGSAICSDGKPITSLMWRANRLADILAKQAADKERLPKWVTGQASSAARLVQYQAARLGYATHEANNHKKEFVCSVSGKVVVSVCRDSTAMRPASAKRSLKRPAAVAPKHGSDRDQPIHNVELMPPQFTRTTINHVRPRRSGFSGSAATAQRGRKRAAASHAENLRQQAADETRVAQWIEGLKLQRSAGQPSAQERLDGIRERIKKRQRLNDMLFD